MQRQQPSNSTAATRLVQAIEGFGFGLQIPETQRAPNGGIFAVTMIRCTDGCEGKLLHRFEDTSGSRT
eukprot:56856-Rhodomonas_salina.1